jgi:hypothetical protein
MYFMSRGYVPLVMDTDGVNFETPVDRENYTYVGKGLNGLVKEGEIYTGAEADVAEYNDLFMRNEMGLDIDGVWPATINVARKNYALLTDKGKVKLTGNSIKSKKLQTYVAEFLDKGLRMLLDGKGGEFLDFYYEYVSKIYNKEIPLAKIANKARVKQSIDDYKVHITKTTKSGSLMSRQAHMELLINAGKKPGLGDTIYYVNNGVKKSHGDVQKKTTKMTKKQIEEYTKIHGAVPPEMLSKSEVILNCYLIDEKEIENNPDLLGDYNVLRALAAFNKRIEPLLVVYSPDIRKDILIENPIDQPIFTKSQTELGRGYPMKEKDQDNLDEVLTLSDMEIVFWQTVGIDPYYMYIDNTLDLVDKSRVDNNRKLMLENKVKKSVDDDDLYEFDEDGDLMSLVFD